MERKLFQRRLQRAVDNYGGDIFTWQAMLTLQGARFPEAGDTFTYPVGSSLEFLRQGLLTCNTYISALTLPASSIPSFVPTSAVSTTAPPPNRRFYVGQVMMRVDVSSQWVDALDTVEKWLEATVLAVDSDYVFVHYNGWASRWDEWLHVVSPVSPFPGRTRRGWRRSGRARGTCSCGRR